MTILLHPNEPWPLTKMKQFQQYFMSCNLSAPTMSSSMYEPTSCLLMHKCKWSALWSKVFQQHFRLLMTHIKCHDISHLFSFHRVIPFLKRQTVNYVWELSCDMQSPSTSGWTNPPVALSSQFPGSATSDKVPRNSPLASLLTPLPLKDWKSPIKTLMWVHTHVHTHTHTDDLLCVLT